MEMPIFDDCKNIVIKHGKYIFYFVLSFIHGGFMVSKIAQIYQYLDTKYIVLKYIKLNISRISLSTPRYCWAKSIGSGFGLLRYISQFFSLNEIQCYKKNLGWSLLVQSRWCIEITFPYTSFKFETSVFGTTSGLCGFHGAFESSNNLSAHARLIDLWSSPGNVPSLAGADPIKSKVTHL